MEAMTENKEACAEQGRSVPPLRFGEYNDSWEKMKLGDVGKVKMCKRIFSNQTTEKGDIPFYKIGTFGKVADAFIDIDLYNEFKLKFSYPKVGEILMSASGTLGRTVVFDGSPSYYQDSNIVWLENNEELITNNFLYYIYQIVRYDSEGGTIQRLYNSIILNTKFHKPTLPEQQKIATFLSSVDAKLQQLSKKKSLLADYKKGVMQKLFNYECENDELRIRFKDAKGKDYPDWEEKKLGEVSTKKSSNISANAIVENVGNYKLYGASGFLKGVDFYREESPFISIVKDGAGVGRVLLCEPFSSVLGTLDVIKPTKGNNLYFIYTLLQRIPFVKYTIGSTIPHIYFKDYSNEKVGVPKFEEQQKIATFLSALDVKIEMVNTQINNTQGFKKGLLQQMFV